MRHMWNEAHNPTERVFVHMLRGDALYLRDTQGRPLGEQGAPELYTPDIRDERACPFQDARQDAGLPINAAALTQVRQHWRGSLEGISALASAMWGEQETWSGHQTWVLNACHLVAPSLLHLSGDGPIPTHVAATYKTSLGFSTVLPSVLMAFPGASDACLQDQWEPDLFFAMLLKEGWLVGNHQVCAGSRAAIGTYFEHLTRAFPSAQAPEFAVDPVTLEAFARASLEAWAMVGMLTATAHEFLQQGHYDETPGYERGEEVCDPSWPITAQWTRSRASRAIEVANSFAGLTPQHYLVLYPEGAPNERLEALFDALPEDPGPECLATLDSLALAALQAPAADMMRVLGQEDAVEPLTRAALRALLERPPLPGAPDPETPQDTA